jgi:hypothetical protein
MTDVGTTYEIGIVPGSVNEPSYSAAALSYKLVSAAPEHVFVVENLAVRELKSGAPLIDSLPSLEQVIYLGFDKPLKGAPISLYFLLGNYLYDEDFRPDFEWSISAGDGKWIPINALDGTQELTRSGYLSFVPPDVIETADMFGKNLYWLRGVNKGTRFGVKPPDGFKAVKRLLKPFYWLRGINKARGFPPLATPGKTFQEEAAEDGTDEIPTCRETSSLELLAGSIDTGGSPTFRRIDSNAVESRGTFAVEGEVLGSSDGSIAQEFVPSRTPVFEERLYVNEVRHVGEAEVQNLRRDGYEVDVDIDEAGKPEEVWVKWRPVRTFLGARPDERVYTVDPTTGVVRFGDGTRGRIPPIGRDNIVMSYRTGGGLSTNVAPLTVADLMGAVSFVDEVYNPIPAAGGEDREPIDTVFERGPASIRHRDRAVTVDDFEDVVRERFRGLAKVKCFPETDAAGNACPGSVTVVIVPWSSETRPELPVQLRDDAEALLRERTSAIPVFENNVNVVGPVYVECGVSAEVKPVDLDAATELKNVVYTALENYLHPLSGGDEDRGWPLARAPSLSDILAVIESVPTVDSVEDASFVLRVSGGGNELHTILSLSDYVYLPPFALISSGVHSVTVA